MVEHIVVVTWYGGERKTGETNAFGFGVLVTTGPDIGEDWIGRDVYIAAEHLDPRPVPGCPLIGCIDVSQKGLALRNGQPLETWLREQPEMASDILSRIQHVDTYIKYSSNQGSIAATLSDGQIMAMLRAPARRAAVLRATEHVDRDPGALDCLQRKDLEFLFEHASVGLRLTQAEFADFLQAEDIIRVAETAPSDHIPYELSDVWSRAVTRSGELHSQARRVVFSWRCSHPQRPESANPLNGLRNIDVRDDIVAEAQQLPLRFRVSHSSWQRLISSAELAGVITPKLLTIDVHGQPEVDELPFVAGQDEWPEWLHQLLTGRSVEIEHEGDQLLFARVPDEAARKLVNALIARTLSSETALLARVRDAWLWFLIHPNTVKRRASYLDVEDTWDQILQAQLQTTNNVVLLGRALELNWKSEVSTIESLLSRSDDSWIDSVSQESKTRLVYFLVSQDRRARLQAIENYLDGAAGVLASFAIAEWSGQEDAELRGTGMLVEQLERVATECLLKGEDIAEHFAAIAPPCLDRASGHVKFCEAKLKLSTESESEVDDRKFWCGRARNYRQPRGLNGTTSSGLRVMNCAAGPLSPVGSVNHWTIAEFLDLLKVSVYPAHVLGPMDLAVRLGAWINRVIEVEERLRCRTCNELMTQDFEFAKFEAVYRNTMLDCRKGEGHDQGVYLSHCWNCSKEKLAGLTFVDGRDCTVRFVHRDYPGVARYLLCINCGAGPTQKATGDSEVNAYELIGRLCPKCGIAVESWGGNFQNRSCPHCNHQIRLTWEHWNWISKESDKKKTRLWRAEATSQRLDGASLVEPPRFDDPPPVGEPPPWEISKGWKR